MNEFGKSSKSSPQNQESDNKKANGKGTYMSLEESEAKTAEHRETSNLDDFEEQAFEELQKILQKDDAGEPLSEEDIENKEDEDFQKVLDSRDAETVVMTPQKIQQEIHGLEQQKTDTMNEINAIRQDLNAPPAEVIPPSIISLEEQITEKKRKKGTLVGNPEDTTKKNKKKNEDSREEEKEEEIDKRRIKDFADSMRTMANSMQNLLNPDDYNKIRGSIVGIERLIDAPKFDVDSFNQSLRLVASTFEQLGRLQQKGVTVESFGRAMSQLRNFEDSSKTVIHFLKKSESTKNVLHKLAGASEKARLMLARKREALDNYFKTR